MIISGYDKTLKVIRDNVSVEANYETKTVVVVVDDKLMHINIKGLDDLTMALATLAHYAEVAGLHEIEGK